MIRLTFFDGRTAVLKGLRWFSHDDELARELNRYAVRRVEGDPVSAEAEAVAERFKVRLEPLSEMGEPTELN